MFGFTLTFITPPDIGAVLLPYVNVVLMAAVKFAVAESPVKIPLIVKEEMLLVNVTLSPIFTLPEKVVALVPEIFWLLVENRKVPVPELNVAPLFTIPFWNSNDAFPVLLNDPLFVNNPTMVFVPVALLSLNVPELTIPPLLVKLNELKLSVIPDGMLIRLLTTISPTKVFVFDPENINVL